MLLFQSVFIAMIFFSMARLLNLIWNWGAYHVFSAQDLAVAFGVGLRFDLAAICLWGAIPALVALGLWWTKNQKLRRTFAVGFVLFQLPGMIFTLGDVDYVNLQGRRLTKEALFIFGEIPGKFWQIAGSYAGLFALSSLMLAGFVFAIYWLCEKTRPKVYPFKFRILGSLLALVFVVVGARGGFQKKPVGFSQAQVFTQTALNNLLLNSSFTVVQTLKREPVPRVKYFQSRDEMLSYLPGSAPKESKLEALRPKTQQNVVLIIFESLNLDYTGLNRGEKSYTPFLDSLGRRGLFFERNFANARRSIEGIGALLAGVPAWMNEPFLSSQYMSNYVLGVGSELSRHGYHSSFFHGGQNGTMYFDSFIQSLGIENYYGLNEYGKNSDYDGTWGVYDGPFLKYMVKKLNEFPKPFFSAVFTLSSHNPFRIPEAFQNRFPKGNNEILESIGYTDFALQDFFAEAEKQDWYANTLFIITGDHTYKASRAEFDNEVGAYRTPLIFFHPQMKWPAIDTQAVTSQIDVLPSIFDFLGIQPQLKNDLGRSVFQAGPRMAMTYSEGRYQLFTKEAWLLERPGTEPEIYPWGSWASAGDPQLKQENLRTELILKMKALKQNFSEGLWDNRLYYPVK